MKGALMFLGIFTLLLSGCSSAPVLHKEEKQVSLVEFCNQKEITKFADSFFEDKPIAVSYFGASGKKERTVSTVTNTEFITAAYEALMDITVGERYEGEKQHEGDRGYLFTMEDGKQIQFIFWKKYLAIERDGGINYYRVDHEETLYDLPFPDSQ